MSDLAELLIGGTKKKSTTKRSATKRSAKKISAKRSKRSAANKRSAKRSTKSTKRSTKSTKRSANKRTKRSAKSTKRSTKRSKRSAANKRSASKKRSTKRSANKRSASKRRAKKRSHKGGSNRKSGEWKIHANWMEDRKRMKPIAAFEMDHKINEGECAKEIEDIYDLERSRKNDRSPVWIQRIKLGDKFYYVVFIAVEHGKSVDRFVSNKGINISRDITCFEDEKNIIGVVRANITKLMQSNKTKKEYTEGLRNVFNKYQNIPRPRLPN